MPLRHLLKSSYKERYPLQVSIPPHCIYNNNNNNKFTSVLLILIYNSYCYKKAIQYYSKQGEKIVVLVRILMSKSGFEDEVLIKLIVGFGKQGSEEVGKDNLR
jgi:hypothetical protein